MGPELLCEMANLITLRAEHALRMAVEECPPDNKRDKPQLGLAPAKRRKMNRSSVRHSGWFDESEKVPLQMCESVDSTDARGGGFVMAGSWLR